MKRPEYLNKYLFDWEIIDLVVGGKSSLDSKSFVAPLASDDQIVHFLEAYGFSQDDPVLKAETFGTFQEALQFIKRYFLIEGNSKGLELEIPPILYTLTEVKQLFQIATMANKEYSFEECLWAQVVLKVMHTILHTDKDLRSNYFNQVQTQIFDRFYKYLSRDSEGNLHLGSENDIDRIPLKDFETKAKKSRDSIIIKLLHKAENVAEELFDRIGVRFITESKIDCLRVVKFLYHKNVIVVHNIKPSRSRNSLINIGEFKKHHHNTIRMALRNELSEDRFQQALNRDVKPVETNEENLHSSKNYQAIQFTGRQLIRYKSPFLRDFTNLRKIAKNEDSDLAKKILEIDYSTLTRDVRFFYPFEVQITDLESHKNNMEGEANHEDYKKSQQRSAMLRLFQPLIDYKNLDISID